MWMDMWRDGWTDSQIDVWVDRRMMCGCTEEWTEGWMDVYMRGYGCPLCVSYCKDGGDELAIVSSRREQSLGLIPKQRAESTQEASPKDALLQAGVRRIQRER